jgi:formylglycine-generating enzyme required for sulfatase activity
MLAIGALAQVEIVPSRSRTVRGNGKTTGGANQGKAKSKPRAGAAGRGEGEATGAPAAPREAPAMTRPLEFSIVSPALNELTPKPAPQPEPAASPSQTAPAASPAAGPAAGPAAESVAPAAGTTDVAGEEKEKPAAAPGAVAEPKATAAPAPVEAPVVVAPVVAEKEAAPEKGPERGEEKRETRAPAPSQEVAEKPVAVATPPSEGKRAIAAESGKETAAPRAVKAPEQVFTYEYNSITSDPRGRVVSSEKRVGRYLSEEIGPGTVLEMVEIPAGNFLMGASELALQQLRKEAAAELGKKLEGQVVERLPWEGPQRVVKVNGFHMSKFEITQAQWRAVAALPKVKLELMAEPSEFRGDNLPVERVTWDEAVEFCARLTRATGRKYRLPTEAEWEYACRAGSESSFHFGETLTTEWASFNGRRTFGKSPKGEARLQPSPVGSYGLANAFGLYDMHGNVWEWCQDNWHETHLGAPDEAHLWNASGIAYLKALRGGAWDSLAIESRSSSRNRMTAGIRLNSIGFRVVAEPASSNMK